MSLKLEQVEDCYLPDIALLYLMLTMHCHVHGEFRHHNYLSIRDEKVVLLGLLGFGFRN